MEETFISDELNAVENWNKEEKFQLLQALKEYSFHDLDKICENIPTKSLEEISDAIEYYKSKLMDHPILKEKAKKDKRRKVNNLIPLANWAKILTDSLNFKDLHTETATALRLIAEFEDFPDPACVYNIDFKKVYLALANALEGKAMPKDKNIVSVVEKCLIDTALTSKAFIKHSTYRHIIKSINLSDKTVNSFPRPTTNQELANIRHLASQRTYNPFNISEEFLKPSL